MLLTGIDAISLVEYPAIEEDFIALNSQRVEFATQSDEKRILMGAALVPNKPIYRAEGQEEFYVYFSEATIRKASEMFFQKSKQNNATLEHEVGINGLTVVESWIIEDEVHDKSKKYGFDLPVGTWMVSMKVNNPEIWTNFVKTGKVKGFSIEGYFVDKLNLAKQEMAQIEETITRMYSYLSRAEEYYDENDTQACGTISFLLWGGLAGKRWAESKLKELGNV
jgi:hypothetical protein